MARDVFISYSQPDHACAFELVARLEAEGINCWIAPRDIAPSADWAAEIMDAISSVRVMILVFSANSNLSPQVRREVERAVHKQLSVLPFRIEDVPPSNPVGEVTGEEQAADDADRVHRVDDGDHQVGEMIPLLVEHVERRRHGREAHVDTERRRGHPEADVVTGAGSGGRGEIG